MSIRKRILLDLCKIYSPSGHEQEVAHYLTKFLRDYVDDVFIDEVGNVIALKGSGPVIMLHAHMDTVPGQHIIQVFEDRVVGLGVADDKASLAAMACAISEIESPPCKVVFVGVVEEETTSRGTAYLIEEIERGLVPKPRGVIVGEPTGIDRLVYAYRGSAKIRIVSTARGGHASTPQASSNPILKVYELYARLCKLLETGTRYNTVTAVPTMIQGGDAPNKIPEFCELVVDIRIPPGRTCSEVLSKLENLSDKDETSETRVHVDYCIDPVEVSVSNLAARAVTRAVLEVLGKSPTPAKKWGTSDMNLLVKVTQDIIAYGPGQHETTHTRTECVFFNEYEKAIEVYKRAVTHFAKLVQAL